jgi:hypothetical protein
MNNIKSLGFINTSTIKQLNQSTSYPIDGFDKKRMAKALSTEMIELPSGLTREEKRKFLIEHGK